MGFHPKIRRLSIIHKRSDSEDAAKRWQLRRDAAENRAPAYQNWRKFVANSSHFMFPTHRNGENIQFLQK
jgi:hypothetical protein